MGCYVMDGLGADRTGATTVATVDTYPEDIARVDGKGYRGRSIGQLLCGRELKPRVI